MPSLYELAHMLIRLFAAMYLVIGGAALVGIFLVFAAALATGHQAGSTLTDGVVGYLAEYGVAAFIAGLGLFLLSKKIARFAVKS
jgi:hypothetical protein